MDSNMVVIDVSSDEEVDHLVETGNSVTAVVGDCSGDVCDFDFLWKFLDEKEEEDDDSDDVVFLEEVISNPKRNSKSSGATIVGDDDDDCVVLEVDPDKQAQIQNHTATDSDDVLIVAQKGQVACRDYPHARHLCGNFPFATSPHESCCEQCHCYVCDSRAPCLKWGTGSSSIDHCHATEKDEFWKNQRKSFMNIDKCRPSVPGFCDTSLVGSVPQVNPLPPAISLPNYVSQGQPYRPSKPAFTHSLSPGISNIINHGKTQEPGSKCQPKLLTQKFIVNSSYLAIPRDRRNSISLGVQSRLSKRPGTIEIGLTPTNAKRFQHNKTPTSAIAPDIRSPVRCLDFDSLMTPEFHANWNSSQPISVSVAASSGPSPCNEPSHPNISTFENPLSFLSEEYSQPCNSLLPEVENLSNLLNSPLPLESSQTELAHIFPKPLNPNAVRLPVDLVPCQPQACNQSSWSSTAGEGTFQQGRSQTQTANVADVNSCWDTSTSQRNRPPPPELPQLHRPLPLADEPPFPSRFDQQLNGGISSSLPSIDMVDWLSDDQPLETTVPNGLSVIPLESTVSLDRGISFDFYNG